MKKIKLYLEQIKNTVVMRVLEQEGIDKDLSQNVKICNSPQLLCDIIYLRGERRDTDNYTDCPVFKTPEQAKEYLQKVIGWLDEVFYKQLEPKRGDKVLVWHNKVSMNETERIFLTEIKGSECPYVCVDEYDEQAFINGKKFMTANWKNMKPLTKSGYNHETKEYYGETE